MLLKSYISIVSAVIILMASMMQFHHHDCDGNIYIHLTTIEDLAFGSGGFRVDSCSHSDAHEHDTTCSTHDSCAMHIAEYKAVDNDIPTDVECYDLLFDLPHEFKLKVSIRPLRALYYEEDLIINEIAPQSLIAMRAPPICV